MTSKSELTEEIRLHGEQGRLYHNSYRAGYGFAEGEGMLRKFLCLIGMHIWTYKPHIFAPMWRDCSFCKKRQHPDGLLNPFRDWI